MAQTELGDREPLGSREGTVIAAIRASFTLPDASTTMNSRETSGCGGLCLSPAFTNRMSVPEAMGRVLTIRQRLVLMHRFVRDRTQQATAYLLDCHLNTIRLEEHRALQSLVQVFWDEPTYISPPRLRSLAYMQSHPSTPERKYLIGA